MPPVVTVRPNGAAIRAIRVKAGLSRRRLGGMIGRHPASIHNLEHGRRLASEVMINQIANALGVDVAQLCLPDEDDETETGDAA